MCTHSTGFITDCLLEKALLLLQAECYLSKESVVALERLSLPDELHYLTQTCTLEMLKELLCCLLDIDGWLSTPLASQMALGNGNIISGQKMISR